MTYYTKDLYKNAIEEPARYFNNLKIISGYASSKFLKRVINDFPNHKLCLIIGMASRGISKKDHKEFKEICTESDNIEVFYQKETPPNHMKVYQWYNNEVPELSFIGSANFSEAGFFVHDEILSSTINIFSNLIDDVMLKCISCLDDKVKDIIPLYENAEEFILKAFEDEINISSLDEIKKQGDETHRIINKDDKEIRNNRINLKSLLLKDFNSTPYNQVIVELILKDDPHFETRGLNNWNRKFHSKDDSYLDVERTNKLGNEKLNFFPREENIKLISDDNIEWIVKRKGEYGKELVVIDGINFYDYFKDRLELHNEEIISYKDLYNYGRTNIGLYKLNDDEYLLDFSLDK